MVRRRYKVMKDKEAKAMIFKQIKRLRSNLGFTLAELMIAMLILSMVTAVAAGGIPVAINAYTRVVETANAQVLLSTTMTKLREELGTASEIKSVNDHEIVYESENGSESRIYRTDSGIMIREYADVVSDLSDKTYEHLLVSKSAANKNLYVTFGSIVWTESTGIIEIRNVKVLSSSGGEPLAELDFDLPDDEAVDNPDGSIKIRVLSYIY
jgi:prepilin-type N-terminal cleavage/methylation domain-containing protein